MSVTLENGRIAALRTQCAICGSGDLATVLELPKLPLTGIYVDVPPDDDRYAPVDQSLLLCRGCGHGQLRNILDPDFLYGDTYQHRTSGSPIATAGNDFFFDFLAGLSSGRRFQRVVDIGCNDLYLLRKLESLGEQLLGVDPIWKNHEQPSGRIKVAGAFAERVDFSEQLGGPPDLIVSAHTFEHVVDPISLLRHLVNAAAPGALFVVEVPGFDSLLRLARFDQVFHQHLHYYSLASFVRLVREVGACYVAHAFNYGYWGGTMLVAFAKTPMGASDANALPAREEEVVKRLAIFRNQLDIALEHLDRGSARPIYGLGAAQMLPVLAYHMGSDLGFLECVFDDDARRAGLMYPGLAPAIRQPSSGNCVRDGRVLITALDSARPLIRRAAELGARQIVVPVQAF